MITREELDRAIAAGHVSVTRMNRRAVQCAVCRSPVPADAARRLWVDGHTRGFLCWCCGGGALWQDTQVRRAERDGMASF